eukprot:4948030-Pyramimonas_sp.AAC.1
MGEFAQNTGMSFASSLLDLTKAYEKVARVLLVRAAIKHGFNVFILRYLLTVYRGQRRVLLGKMCSRGVFA